MRSPKLGLPTANLFLELHDLLSDSLWWAGYYGLYMVNYQDSVNELISLC